MKTQTPELKLDCSSYDLPMAAWGDTSDINRLYACADTISELYPETKTANRIVIHCADEEPENYCYTIEFFEPEFAHVSDLTGLTVYSGYIYRGMRDVFDKLSNKYRELYFWVEVIDERPV